MLEFIRLTAVSFRLTAVRRKINSCQTKVQQLSDE